MNKIAKISTFGDILQQNRQSDSDEERVRTKCEKLRKRCKMEQQKRLIALKKAKNHLFYAII